MVGALLAVVIPFVVTLVIPVAVIPVVIPISVTAPVSVSVVVPAMIMLEPSAVPLPVTIIEPLSVVMGRNPASPRVRWPSPITLMPAIVTSLRVPVTLDPHELRAGGRRQNSNYACRRRWTNSDSNRHLRECRQGE